MTVNLTLGHTQRIIAAAQKAGLTTQQTAYVLATALWETARSMQPVREAYYLGEPKAENYRKTLRYYPFYGRGFVQLTWEDNYRAYGIADNPDAALEADKAAHIIVDGMKTGRFTGKKLTDYINASKTDYVNARRIVNGTDKASEIAAIAREYEAALSPSRPLLKLGDKGDDVRDLQMLLAARGLYRWTVDGDFGQRTDATVRYFQAIEGLTIDGKAGAQVWTALGV